MLEIVRIGRTNLVSVFGILIQSFVVIAFPEMDSRTNLCVAAVLFVASCDMVPSGEMLNVFSTAGLSIPTMEMLQVNTQSNPSAVVNATMQCHVPHRFAFETGSNYSFQTFHLTI